MAGVSAPQGYDLSPDTAEFFVGSRDERLARTSPTSNAAGLLSPLCGFQVRQGTQLVLVRPRATDPRVLESRMFAQFRLFNNANVEVAGDSRIFLAVQSPRDLQARVIGMRTYAPFRGLAFDAQASSDRRERLGFDFEVDGDRDVLYLRPGEVLQLMIRANLSVSFDTAQASPTQLNLPAMLAGYGG